MRKLASTVTLSLAALAGLSIASGQAAVGGGVSAQDAHYLQTAISGDRFEIIGGKLAMAKSGNSTVQALGHQLVQDHSKSLQDAIELAKQLDVKVPNAPSPSEVWELNMVRSLSGRQFDLAYTTLEVKDHQQDIEEATFEVVHGGAAQVKASARKELPTLKMHLSMSKAAVQRAGGSA
jgi:putative membrane protein